MRIILALFALFSLSAFGATSPEAQKYLVNLLRANDAVHTAFVKNDEQGLKAVWSILDKSLSATHPNELKEFVTESKSAAFKLVSAIALDEKRKFYGDVMKPIVAMLQKFGPIESYRVFTCPMVKKDWIQDIKVLPLVQNPYDPKMVRCGMMRE